MTQNLKEMGKTVCSQKHIDYRLWKLSHFPLMWCTSICSTHRHSMCEVKCKANREKDCHVIQLSHSLELGNKTCNTLRLYHTCMSLTWCLHLKSYCIEGEHLSCFVFVMLLTVCRSELYALLCHRYQHITQFIYHYYLVINSINW